jgi:hypothetical protein
LDERAYPPLPKPNMVSGMTGLVYFGDDQMRAYVDADRALRASLSTSKQAGAEPNTTLAQPFNRLCYEALAAIPFDSDWSDTRERRAYGKRVAESAAQSCDIHLQQRLSTLAAPGAAIAAREQGSDHARLDYVARSLRSIADRGRAGLGDSYPEILSLCITMRDMALQREEAPPTPPAAIPPSIIQEIEYGRDHGWPAETLKRLESMAAAWHQRAAIPAAPSAGEWKCGNEFLPYHPSASHVNPDYRDGWNACYRLALTQPTTVQQAGHCERQMGCVCGGDTQAVRERCGNWVKGGA